MEKIKKCIKKLDFLKLKKIESNNLDEYDETKTLMGGFLSIIVYFFLLYVAIFKGIYIFIDD